MINADLFEFRNWLEQCPTHTPEIIQELSGIYVVIFRPKEERES